MIYVFLIWVSCAVGSAISASNKGNNTFSWFLIGFLLGPIGFILSLVVKKDISEIENRAVRNGDAIKCPDCAELVKTDATICKHCGKKLPTPSQVSHQHITPTTIHKAILNGDWLETSRLIREGADVNERDSDGKTTLTLAHERGDKQIISLLLSKCAK